jgi:two-component system response regulator MprA
VILVVDDERAVREAVRRTLVRGGYEVELAGSGEQALDSLAAIAPEAVVADIGLPGIDGLELCRRLRRSGSRVPILLLTGREAVSERIGGLDVGADDCMVKPFDAGELRARVRALIRRANPPAAAEAACFAEIRLDPSRGAALVAGAPVALTRTEFKLLELLLLNPGRVLSHADIYERVWGYDFGAASNGLRVYVGYLRRKLSKAGARELIHTVRGAGYVLREP